MICNECNRVFSFYQNSRFYLQVAFSSASKLKWMQNERGGKTSEQASRSQKFGVTVKSREKSRGLVSNARIRCTQKKQQPSTTGASRIYGRALLSLSFSLSLGYRVSGRCGAQKKRNLHERTSALHCVAAVADPPKEISFFSVWK